MGGVKISYIVTSFDTVWWYFVSLVFDVGDVEVFVFVVALVVVVAFLLLFG